jgi:hypothetical protein
MNLRPYQHAAIAEIRQAYQARHRAVLFVLPTGGGKGLESYLPPAVGTVSTKCKIEGCCKPVDSHGMCGMHAQRMRRYGDPNYITPEQQRRSNNRAAQLARFDSIKPTTYRKRNGRHEHRVIAEQMIGRPLRPGEIVHHIDGNKHNNDPSNLQIMTQGEHVFEHIQSDALALQWNGRQWSPRELASNLGISTQTIYGRLRAGWSIDQIATTPVRKWERKS